MEGIGSRTGRPSSRYGSAPVFTGPVRRWQKQWVHVSSPSSSVSYNHSNNNSSSSNNNNVSTVRIRRWTPVPSVQSGGDSESVAEERPRRKLRYAPIVVVEGKKKEAEKSDLDVKEVSKIEDQSMAQEALETDENERKSFDDMLAGKPQVEEKSVASTEDLNQEPMDMEGHDEDHDLGGAEKAGVADWVKAAERGFATEKL